MAFSARRIAILAAGTLSAAAALTPAWGASWLEMNVWMSGPRHDAVVPACDEPGVFGRIQSRFSSKEGRFWNSDLQIVGFERVRETAFRPWAPQTIPRRFCSGVALVSDGVKRKVHYVIEEDLGLIGATWGVTWCVAGLDRNWAYNPACKMARP